MIMKKIFKLAKFVGLDYVIKLNGTKKDKAKFKSEAMSLGIIYYIGKEFEPVSTFYQLGTKIVEVQSQGISRYRAEGIMECASDYYVHGYIDSGTIFPNEEVLMRVELINYGLYRVEEDTSEDYSSGLELCPHKEEDTSEDYIETTNVCGVEIKNYSVSFSETMLVHEAVEKELIGFLGDLSLERWDLFDTDIDCTLGLDEQYNNRVTGFIVFGAVLGVFAFDVKYSRDYYLGYMARNYNLRKWEVQELANLIDLGINLDSSVIEPDSLTLQDCLKSFVGAAQGYIRFKSQCYLDYEQTVEKLQTGDWFDRVAKFYLTLVCWGKFKPASCIDDDDDDDDNNIDYYDYPVAIWNYNVNLGFFEGYDMYAIVFFIAKNLNLDYEFIEEHYDGTMDIDTAINILDTWRNQQNKNFKVFPYNEQIKLKVLDHVIRKLKGVH